jgi:hypothetical protein
MELRGKFHIIFTLTPLIATQLRAMCAQVRLVTTEKKTAVPVSGSESKLIGCPFEKQCMRRHKCIDHERVHIEHSKKNKKINDTLKYHMQFCII